MIGTPTQYLNFKNRILSQNIALQVLTNMTSETPENEENEQLLSLHPYLFELLYKTKIVRKILDKTKPIPQEVLEICQNYANALTVDDFLQLRSFALNCFANILGIENNRILFLDRFEIFFIA